jgi:hypothetical protein
LVSGQSGDWKRLDRNHRDDRHDCIPEIWEPSQQAWLNAVLIPNDKDLPARLKLFPFPDGYTDIGDRLSEELLKINPTHGDWHTLGKRLNYNILQARQFTADR